MQNCLTDTATLIRDSVHFARRGLIDGPRVLSGWTIRRVAGLSVGTVFAYHGIPRESPAAQVLYLCVRAVVRARLRRTYGVHA